MATLVLQCSAVALLFTATALAVTPVVSSTTSYGALVSAGLTRDSCSSSLWSNNVVIAYSIAGRHLEG
jgi:precorrin-3B methylase